MFTKVLIVDDHAVISDGVSHNLSSMGINNVHTALYCDEAHLKVKRAIIDEEPFDLIVTDLSFKEDHRECSLHSGEELIQRLREDDSDLKIIVYSMEDHFQKVRTLINEHGVHGYVWKSREGSKDLTKALEIVSKGGHFVSRQLAQALIKKDDTEISDYDIELVKQLSLGLSQSEISKYFKEKNINPSSVSSIEKRLSRLKDQFRAKNPAQLVSILKDARFI